MKSDPKKSQSEKEASKFTPKVVAFISACVLLVVVSAIYLIFYEPDSVAESFYRDRKALMNPGEYGEENSNRKPEKNIFLQ